MKILYVTTVGGTMTFFKSIIKELIEDGNIVDIATNNSVSKVQDFYYELGCKVFTISTSRSPTSSGNLRAVKQIREIAKDYDIVHCHTPLAAAATRLACKGLRKSGLKVVYTAHGFHFYQGAPLKNWIIYYPIEKMCSRWTDLLITINKEDYQLAQQKLKASANMYIPGVGIDVKRFANTVVDKKKKRDELAIPMECKMILSVGELNRNKNHKLVIEALGRMNNDQIHYAIAGKGNQKENLQKLADNLNVNLHLLGYRSDVAELYKVADLFILPSIREGLNVSTMEAMAAGCSVLVSKIRGNTDMVPAANCFSPFSVDEVVYQLERNVIENGDFINGIDYSSINAILKEMYVSILSK